jgi:hypothetical protein
MQFFQFWKKHIKKIEVEINIFLYSYYIVNYFKTNLGSTMHNLR